MIKKVGPPASNRMRSGGSNRGGERSRASGTGGVGAWPPDSGAAKLHRSVCFWDKRVGVSRQEHQTWTFSLVLPSSKAVPDEDAQQNGQFGRKIVKEMLEIQGRYGRGPTYKSGSDSKIST